MDAEELQIMVPLGQPMFWALSTSENDRSVWLLRSVNRGVCAVASFGDQVITACHQGILDHQLSLNDHSVSGTSNQINYPEYCLLNVVLDTSSFVLIAAYPIPKTCAAQSLAPQLRRHAAPESEAFSQHISSFVINCTGKQGPSQIILS